MQFAKKLIGNEEERAVSPVIGVILMVAITVILAAVIAAFVLDLGSSMGDSGPTTQLAMTDHSDAEETSSEYNAFVIAHNGGDSFSGSDIEVVIRDADSNAEQARWDSQTWESGTALAIHLNGDASSTNPLTTGASVSTGDSLVISDDVDGSGDTQFGNDGISQYTIQIVHKPSESVVGESTVDLS